MCAGTVLPDRQAVQNLRELAMAAWWSAFQTDFLPVRCACWAAGLRLPHACRGLCCALHDLVWGCGAGLPSAAADGASVCPPDTQFTKPGENKVLAACERAPLFASTPLGAVSWLFNFTQIVFDQPQVRWGPGWLAARAPLAEQQGHAWGGLA